MGWRDRREMEKETSGYQRDNMNLELELRSGQQSSRVESDGGGNPPPPPSPHASALSTEPTRPHPKTALLYLYL